MARLTSVLGGIKGSVGGITFASNKSGQIMRQRVTPTSNATVNSITARTSFARAVQAWNKLTDDQRSSYVSFAADGSRFNPIKRLNTGNQSGSNAFTSLNAFCANVMNTVSATASLSELNGTLITTTNPVYPSVPNTAPTFGMTSMLNNNSEAGVSMQIGGVSFDNTYRRIFFQVLLDGGIYPVPFGTGIRTLVDMNGNRLGFCLYTSSYVNRIGDRPRNRYQNMVAATPMFETTGPIPPTQGFEFHSGYAKNYQGSKYGYVAGKVAEFTLFAYSEAGMGINLGGTQIILP
jgi:hypothetical protein